ncbi:hypothetical protein ERW49_03625 [Aliivibrio finisterrensis]|uniref:Lipoprotein n=1 Tax=Aliivibrio finisterrensis TaxID=511998 RepID=A0A4Q5KNQ0_9GAMM|nr:MULTISPECIES: hypothetical protein [Aliivibrio]MDD9174066.1 hypothetical protein [Aliivibrio sp. S3TY1]MDD9191143.1 hypothetical protein [Aliivibrio sp. S2TY2]RYU48153.1 hypothetical protein ERW49_03625 [Aliivibrio finisterrensis]
MKRNILTMSLISIISGCYHSSNVDIDIWVPENKAPQITIKKDIDYWNKKGYHDGACGWTLSVNVSMLPPPNSPDYIYGTEIFIEYDSNGKIITQWAAPANTYPIAIKDNLIFTDSGLEISSDGELKSTVYEKQNIIHISCPKNLDVDNSDYLRCAILSDSPLGEGRNIAYNAPCT